VTAAATTPAAARPRLDRRVLLAIPLWDYGDPARGASLADAVWRPVFESLVREVHVLPIDRSMHAPRSQDGELLEAVDRLSPDLVVFSTYQDDFAPETLQRLRDETTTLAFFWDDHWRFDGFSSRYATLYDYVVTTDPCAVPRYRALGGTPILTQYAGMPDPEGALPPEDDREYLRDVSFVGGVDPWRAWLVDRLRRNGVEVECFGAGWPNGRVEYDEMNEIFRTSRINLNVSNSRQHDTRFLLADPRNYAAARASGKVFEQIKARHFEIPAAGGFELTFYAVGLEDFLRIGEEIAIYTTPEDCLLQVRRFLAEPERRIAMARRAWERCRAEHTYERRIAEWLAAIWPES
jgi:spore maturation protein CgeB